MIDGLLSGAIGIAAIGFLVFCYRGFARTQKALKTGGHNMVHPLGQIDSSHIYKMAPRYLGFGLLVSTVFTVSAYEQSSSGNRPCEVSPATRADHRSDPQVLFRSTLQILNESTVTAPSLLAKGFNGFEEWRRSFLSQLDFHPSGKSEVVSQQSMAGTGLGCRFGQATGSWCGLEEKYL